MIMFNTQVIKVNPDNPEPLALDIASDIIKKGGTLIFPTDTVYGLGCDAFQTRAVKTIFELKNRPVNKPMPLLVSGAQQAADLVSGPITALGRELMQAFWPGALTLILPARSGIPDIITGGTKKIGVRMPDSKLVSGLISLTGVPLIATSVNLSGNPTGREINQIITEWCSRVDLILDAGDTKKIFASTVVDLTVSPPKIIREEAIGAEQLQSYLTRGPGKN